MRSVLVTRARGWKSLPKDRLAGGTHRLADGGNCPPCPAGLTYQKAATVIASIAPVMAGQ